MSSIRTKVERQQRQRGTVTEDDVEHNFEAAADKRETIGEVRSTASPSLSSSPSPSQLRTGSFAVSTAMFLQVQAALLLHAPGLFLLLSHTNRMVTSVKACAGAVVEGALIFELLWMTYRRIKNARNDRNPCRIIGLVLLLFMQCCIYLIFLFGDYVFQDQSGGLLPDKGVVVAGLKESHRLWKVHMNQDPGKPIMHLSRVCLCFAGGIRLRMLSDRFSKRWRDPNKNKSTHSSPRSERMRLLLLFFLAAHLFAFGVWIPVVHGCVSVVGYALWPSTKPQYPTIKDVMLPTSVAPHQQQRPNVVLLIHESTSGSVLFNSKDGRAMTPFIQKLTDDLDFYHFRHSRAVSGNTIDAVPSILAGCLPLSEKGRRMTLSRSIATDFKRHGYSTASFSSADLNFETNWQSLQQFFTANFDEVHDPTSHGFPLINVEGSDDRLMAPVFEKWWNRQQHNTTASSNPLFAQFYLFNSHYPYVTDKTSSARRNPYISSFQSLDQTMERLFSFLNETGQLNNTIVVGSSDHGEHTREMPGDYGRLSHFNTPILQTFSYMYMPSQLASPLTKQTLRYNTNQTVSTLDIYVALQHVLAGNTTTPTQQERDHCVTGLDLLGTKIPDNRLVLSWNALSSGSTSNILTALSDRHHGLFLQRDGQQINNREINFRTCKPMTLAFCYRELKNRTYWAQFLSNFQNSSSTSLQETFVYDLLVKEIGKKVNSLPQE